MQHYGLFPVDVNRAPFEMLLRVPGIGPKSARRIWRARKQAALGLDELKRMGAVSYTHLAFCPASLMTSKALCPA